jgi:citrate lyase subunit alpha/citrate CoA-transferase
VIVVTDNLVPFPCVPWQIQGNNVDFVVEVESIGDPAKIVSGTTQITRSPDRLRIAETGGAVSAGGGNHEERIFVSGGSGRNRAGVRRVSETDDEEDGVKARFVRGGSTKFLVELLQEGLTDYILDGQTFDLDGVKSIANDPRHVATSPFTSYNYHGKGNFASLVDAVVLGATEVDVNFNANVVTHSDGRLLHGIGGWQNCLFAGCTILALPSFRDRIPVIVDEVTTMTGPGEMIDVVVTERGIAINPRRTDLLDAVKGSKLPVRPIQDIKAEVEKICGKPARPKLGDRPCAVVKWVDGTVLDTVWQVTALLAMRPVNRRDRRERGDFESAWTPIVQGPRQRQGYRPRVSVPAQKPREGWLIFQGTGNDLLAYSSNRTGLSVGSLPQRQQIFLLEFQCEF